MSSHDDYVERTGRDVAGYKKPKKKKKIVGVITLWTT